MIRSLFAVIAAVIAGFALAKLVEGGGAAVTGAAPGEGAYDGLLLLGWFLGAFMAAVTAMVVGARWAPLGAVAAASLFLGAAVTLFSYPMSWFMWPGALLVTALGAYGAIRFTGAKSVYPARAPKTGLFDD